MSTPAARPDAASSGPEFRYTDLLPTHGSNGADQTPYRLVTTEGVSTFEANGRTFLQVDPEAIRRPRETTASSPWTC